MIESLYLRNFRRFESLNLSFTEGVNGVFGPNYRGKSTVMLAIAVALAGPGWARGRNLVRRGEKSFEVQLVLTLAGKRYRVMRSKSSASLTELNGTDERLLANQQSNVNIELGKLLGMTPARWLELRYVQQKEAASMFKAGATKLNTLVEELTGVRTISLVIEKLAQRKKENEIRLDTLSDGIWLPEEYEAESQRYGDVAKQISDLEAQLVTLVEQDKAAQDRVKGYDAEYRDLQGRVESARAQVRTRAAREHAVATAKGEVAGLVPPAKSSDDLRGELAMQEETFDAWTTWLREYRAADASCFKVLGQLEQADRRLAEAGTPVVTDDLERECEQLRTQLDELTITTLPALQSDRRTAMDTRGKLLNEIKSGVCQSCDRAFDDHADKLPTLQQDLAKVSSLVSQLDHQLRDQMAGKDALADKLKALQGQITQARQVQAQRGSLLQRVDELRQELAQAQAVRKQLLDDAGGETEATVTAELAEMKQAIEQARADYMKTVKHETAIQSAKDRLLAAESALDQLGEVPSDDQLATQEEWLRSLQDMLMEARTELAEVQKARAPNEALLKSLRESNSRLDVQLKEQGGRMQQVEELAKQTVDVNELRNHLRNNRSRYLQAAWDAMMGRASMFADTVTGGHISAISRTQDGDFEFIEQGETAAVVDASGAQEAILGMAVQTALAEVLPTTLDLLLADEPAADMDADHSGAALLTLSTLAKQAVVISHHRMDESLCKQVIEL